MQTFLPVPSFAWSVGCLDDRRLGKQRVEAFQILVALEDPWAVEQREARGLPQLSRPSRWRSHPAVEMWRGSEPALRLYMRHCVVEWARRGFKNTLAVAEDARTLNAPAPAWWGDDRLHSSHRANLLRKDPAHYGRFGWGEAPALGYWWPTRQEARP